MEKKVGGVDLDELMQARIELDNEKGIETDPELYKNYNPNRKSDEEIFVEQQNSNSQTNNQNDIDELSINNETTNENLDEIETLQPSNFSSEGDQKDEENDAERGQNGAKNDIKSGQNDAKNEQKSEKNDQNSSFFDTNLAKNEPNFNQNEQKSVQNLTKKSSKDMSVYDNFADFEIINENETEEQIQDTVELDQDTEEPVQEEEDSVKDTQESVQEANELDDFLVSSLSEIDLSTESSESPENPEIVEDLDDSDENESEPRLQDLEQVFAQNSEDDEEKTYNSKNPDDDEEKTYNNENPEFDEEKTYDSENPDDDEEKFYYNENPEFDEFNQKLNETFKFKNSKKIELSKENKTEPKTNAVDSSLNKATEKGENLESQADENLDDQPLNNQSKQENLVIKEEQSLSDDLLGNNLSKSDEDFDNDFQQTKNIFEDSQNKSSLEFDENGDFNSELDKQSQSGNNVELSNKQSENFATNLGGQDNLSEVIAGQGNQIVEGYQAENGQVESGQVDGFYAENEQNEGYEVENSQVEKNFIDFVNAPEFENSNKTDFIIGVDEGNKVVVKDLVDMLNVAIFSKSKQNRFKILSEIILGLAFKCTNNEVKFVVCDEDEKSNLKVFDKFSFLAYDRVARSSTEMYDDLTKLANEIDGRYDKMAKINVSSIDEFNKVLTDADIDPLPYIVLTYNSFNLSGERKKGDDILLLLQKIIRFGRLAGVYVYLSTDKAITDEQINYNLSTRIAFKTNDEQESIMQIGDPSLTQLSSVSEFVFKSIFSETEKLSLLTVTNKEVDVIIKNLDN